MSIIIAPRCKNSKAVTKAFSLISLAFHSELQLGPQHSCGNLKGPAACGTNRMLHSELPLHRPSMGLSHVTNWMCHCRWAAQWDIVFRTLSVPLKLLTAVYQVQLHIN